jgi:cytochrome c553
MTMKAALATTFCVMLLTAAVPATASAADVEAGKETAAQHCATCHGSSGIGTSPDVPHLAGQHADYMSTALQMYKDGRRAGDFMVAMIVAVGALSGEELSNVAAYYASLTPFTEVAAQKAEGAPPPDEDPFAAVKAMTEACVGCHGEDGNSDLPGSPSLAGQHAQYLVDSLNAYKSGTRKHDVMQAFVEPLSTAEIDEIAFYYAVKKPKRAETPMVGDAFAGRAPASACSVCHGEDGNTDDPKTPRLAGLDSEYLVAAIKAYQDGAREHSAMQDIVAGLNETDIANMSAYYASKEPEALPVRKPLTTKEWAEKCNRCHGPGGRSEDPRFPVLAGQSHDYLIKTLKHYHGGDRGNAMMYAMSFAMNEADILKLAAYYARGTGD